jgi:malonyl CoA-acyl carrier protein transacylase
MDKDKLFNEVISNIRKDRLETESLLIELKNELAAGETTHARSGIVAAKYVETLQRSNEQIVKLIAMLQKDKEKELDVSLSNDEKENIFELIKEAH